jgi:hypothetical protein
MTLDELLAAFDATAANLDKLDRVWRQAQDLTPPEISFGSTAEYDDLRRSWRDLAAALPPVDGFRIDCDLADLDELARARFDAREAGEPLLWLAVEQDAEVPGQQLAEYRFRYNRARRQAVRSRVQDLVAHVDRALAELVRRVPPETQQIDDPTWTWLEQCLDELAVLIADTVTRRGRWSDLSRHRHFAQGHDLRDIAEMDWPSVKPDILAAVYTEVDPLPVPSIDLGTAAAAGASGDVTTRIDWSKISSEEFERLLADLLSALPGYQNVMWVTKHNAPDGGRDLTAEKVYSDSGGLVRTDRVIVQAKHHTATSLSHADLAHMLADLQLLEPPPVDWLIVATTGALTARAHEFVERHNNSRTRPFIDMWAEHRLTGIVTQKPGLVAAYRLR